MLAFLNELSSLDKMSQSMREKSTWLVGHRIYRDDEPDESRDQVRIQFADTRDEAIKLALEDLYLDRSENETSLKTQVEATLLAGESAWVFEWERRGSGDLYWIEQVKSRDDYTISPHRQAEKAKTVRP
jgi:hypothetical protein